MTKELTLKKEGLSKLFDKLDGYKLFARVMTDGPPLYMEVTEQMDAALKQLDMPGNAAKSPKEYFFPDAEVLYRYKMDGEDIEVQADREAPGKQIILGMRPCDARSLFIMDKVFLRDPADPYYKDRRDSTVVIGLACNSSLPNCFCTSMGGSPHSTEGQDILLTDLGDRYFVEVLTEKGEEIVKAAPDLFTEPEAGDKDKKKAAEKAAEESFVRKLDTEAVIEALDGTFGHDYWDHATKSCLGCGACTYICPTCHCFDIRDSEGKRIRTWDSCQFPLFTLHTSSHNPRTDKKSRLRNRMYHKFKYLVDAHGRVGCVGCGRCITLCGGTLDLIDILQGLVEAKKGGEVKGK